MGLRQIKITDDLYDRLSILPGNSFREKIENILNGSVDRKDLDRRIKKLQKGVDRLLEGNNG